MTTCLFFLLLQILLIVSLCSHAVRRKKLKRTTSWLQEWSILDLIVNHFYKRQYTLTKAIIIMKSKISLYLKKSPISVISHKTDLSENTQCNCFLKTAMIQRAMSHNLRDVLAINPLIQRDCPGN